MANWLATPKFGGDVLRGHDKQIGVAPSAFQVVYRIFYFRSEHGPKVLKTLLIEIFKPETELSKMPLIEIPNSLLNRVLGVFFVYFDATNLIQCPLGFRFQDDETSLKAGNLRRPKSPLFLNLGGVFFQFG